MKNSNVFVVFLVLFWGGLLLCQDIFSKNILAADVYGVFKRDDMRLEGIRWGNWGSRPYEYYWVSRIVPVANKRVIDLGVGLPSQHTWYRYVIDCLKPSYYIGIDADGRIKDEEVKTEQYQILHMDMSDLSFQDKEFDIAYCISTFEHIPYHIFMKAIKEVYRVLKDDGLLILTLDERWDKNYPVTDDSNWNNLEQSLSSIGLVDFSEYSFGLPDFLNIIQKFFVPVDNNILIDLVHKTIYSQETGAVYYRRGNRDGSILYSPECYNSCVSYAVLKKNIGA